MLHYICNTNGIWVFMVVMLLQWVMFAVKEKTFDGSFQANRLDYDFWFHHPALYAQDTSWNMAA